MEITVCRIISTIHHDYPQNKTSSYTNYHHHHSKVPDKHIYKANHSPIYS